MKVVIVEDELLAAEYLAELLSKLPEGIEVVKIISSINEAVEYFKLNSSPDLIFCDIQLGDGHSFEIFSRVKIDVPVIFCTAYNQYALQAFKNNGIDYVLKPFTTMHIKESIEKYKTLRQKFANTVIDYENILKSLHEYSNDKRVSSLLINFKEKIIPIKIMDIALFTIEHKMTQIITFDKQKYFTNYTLDELEAVCGKNFYRANRQFLINRETVQEALQYFARKLVVKLKIEGKHEIIISKSKVSEFLSWLRS